MLVDDLWREGGVGGGCRLCGRSRSPSARETICRATSPVGLSLTAPTNSYPSTDWQL